MHIKYTIFFLYFAEIAAPELDERKKPFPIEFLVGVHVPFDQIWVVQDAANRAGYYETFVVTAINARFKPVLDNLAYNRVPSQLDLQI